MIYLSNLNKKQNIFVGIVATTIICTFVYNKKLHVLDVLIEKEHTLTPYDRKTTCTNSSLLPRNKSGVDGFYRYILERGIPVRILSEKVFRIGYENWNCKINTSIAENFKKRCITWKDMFETNIEVLSRKTVFTKDALRTKMGVLPKDGTPVTLVAREGGIKIPNGNVIIRFNHHGLHNKTDMIMAWPKFVKTITMCAREQPTKEIIRWTNYKPYGSDLYAGLFNTSIPLVVPEEVWGFGNLTYYRGPLFFMKGGYFLGHMAECRLKDHIGLAALNRLVHLKGDISTLGFTTVFDKYNRRFEKRVYLLAHKLALAYFVVSELTYTIN